jgi:hypothetical protein
MMISFRSPLTPDAVEFLTEETRVDFGMQDMRHWFCATAWNDTGSVIGVLACEPKTWRSRRARLRHARRRLPLASPGPA